MFIGLAVDFYRTLNCRATPIHTTIGRCCCSLDTRWCQFNRCSVLRISFACMAIAGMPSSNWIERNFSKNECVHGPASMWFYVGFSICANQKGIAWGHSSLAVICDTNVKYLQIDLVLLPLPSVFHLKLIRSHVCIKWYRHANWIWFIPDMNGTAQPNERITFSVTLCGVRRHLEV